jgi:hypothetical protein
MTNIIIDKERALELLAEAVKLKGADYVDVGTDPDGDGECRYYAFTLSQEKDDEENWRSDMTVVTATIGEDGRANPGCFVGHVYYALGFDPLDIQAGVVFDTLLMNDDGSGAVFNAAGATELLTKDGDTVTLTASAQMLLGKAQQVQDGGGNWGKAISEAVDYLEHQQR